MKYHLEGIYLQNGQPVNKMDADPKTARESTMACRILRQHEKEGAAKDGQMHLVFDAMLSHDITYVGIIQTARASGLKAFPMPSGFSLLWPLRWHFCSPALQNHHTPMHLFRLCQIPP